MGLVGTVGGNEPSSFFSLCGVRPCAMPLPRPPTTPATPSTCPLAPLFNQPHPAVPRP